MMASSQDQATRGKKSELSEEGRVALALRSCLFLGFKRGHKRFTRGSQEVPRGFAGVGEEFEARERYP